MVGPSVIGPQLRNMTISSKASAVNGLRAESWPDQAKLMLARYHVSSFGRFTSVDPTRESVNLETPATWNRYSYSRNNPINRFDPDGRADRSTMDMDRRSGAWAHAGGFREEGTGVRLLRYAVTGGLGLFLAPVAVLAVEASPILSFAVQNPENHLAAYEMLAAATDSPSALRGAAAALSIADDAARGASRIDDANKLNHIFGKAGRNLGPLVERFGSQEAAFNAVQDATQALVKSQGLSGIFKTTVQVGGRDLIVKGNVIDGVVRIGTFWPAVP